MKAKTILARVVVILYVVGAMACLWACVVLALRTEGLLLSLALTALCAAIIGGVLLVLFAGARWALDNSVDIREPEDRQ